MTVFLTTQYLEEADVLADRVGIIDRGTIVAEGTPAQLKAEVGRPSVEVVPVDPGQVDQAHAALAGVRRLRAQRRRQRHRVAARRRRRSWPTWSARSTRPT